MVRCAFRILSFLFPLVLFFQQPAAAQKITSYVIRELRGMEDAMDRTHLLYLKEGSYSDSTVDMTEVSLHDFNPERSAEPVLFRETGFMGSQYSFSLKYVNDFAYWNNNLDKIIYGGVYLGECTSPLLKITNPQMPAENLFPQAVDGIERIGLSQQNDQIIFASTIGSILVSTNRGSSWSTINGYFLLAVSPQDDKVLFALDAKGNLAVSKNQGAAFSIADTAKGSRDDRVLFDNDGTHIYRVSGSRLFVSGDKGESWSLKYTGSWSKMAAAVNSCKPGELYLAEGHTIKRSCDFGDNFSYFNKTERQINSMYKKPASDLLYAAGKYWLYEITSDTVKTIRILPSISDRAEFYPLAVGNKWKYKVYALGTSYGYMTREVTGDTVLNNKKYAVIKEDYKEEITDTRYVFERVDTLKAIVYRYSPNAECREIPIEDLAAEKGDLLNFSIFDTDKPNRTEVGGETDMTMWEIKSPMRVSWAATELHNYVYQLWKGFGIELRYSTHAIQTYQKYYLLDGCEINGKAYGNSVTGIAYENNTDSPKSFELKQNYPNPFNPATTISFSIPRSGAVKLRVFDILGKEVAALVNEFRTAGEHKVQFNASMLPSGVYIYRLEADGLRASGKMMLAK